VIAQLEMLENLWLRRRCGGIGSRDIAEDVVAK
jgi:hypothetical protein